MTMKEDLVWRILFVDDDEDICRQVKEYLEGEKTTGDGRCLVETEQDFALSMEHLGKGKFDMVILDVRLGSKEEENGEDPGIDILNEIKQTRFIPVLFYTGLPNLVRGLESPIVRVTEKTDGFDSLLESINEIIETKLPMVNRAMLSHVEEVQRKYMWDFVEKNWNLFGDSPDRGSLSFLLARRLAVSLTDSNIRRFALELGGTVDTDDDVSEFVMPMRYYLRPPVEMSYLAGDLFYGTIGDREGHWVLLNPSCDMVENRPTPDRVVLAGCALLHEQIEYIKWEKGFPDPSKTAYERFRSLITNNRQKAQPMRYHFLPAALDIPDLVVDFLDLKNIPYDGLAELDRKASLDSPFAEEFISRFTTYIGRIGSPDFDADSVIQRLKAEMEERSQNAAKA